MDFFSGLVIAGLGVSLKSNVHHIDDTSGRTVLENHFVYQGGKRFPAFNLGIKVQGTQSIVWASDELETCKVFTDWFFNQRAADLFQIAGFSTEFEAKIEQVGYYPTITRFKSCVHRELRNEVALPATFPIPRQLTAKQLEEILRELMIEPPAQADPSIPWDGTPVVPEIHENKYEQTAPPTHFH